MNTNNKSYLSNYLTYCQIQKRLDFKTIKAYTIDLNQFLCFIADTDLKEISISILESYISFLHTHYKSKTVKRKIASVKAFFTIWNIKKSLKKILLINYTLVSKSQLFYLKQFLYTLSKSS